MLSFGKKLNEFILSYLNKEKQRTKTKSSDSSWGNIPGKGTSMVDILAHLLSNVDDALFNVFLKIQKSC